MSLHQSIRAIDRIPWWLMAFCGMVGFLGMVRLVHRGMGNP